MDFCKKCLIIVAGIYSVIADFDHEHYRTYSYNEANIPPPKPWFLDDYSSYIAEPSESIAHYAYTYPYDNIEHSSSYVPTYTDYSSPSTSDSFLSSTKKIPNEDKNFKKPIPPFYTLTDKDPAKLKEFIMKSGSPYCQKIKSKRTNMEGTFKPEAMTCYNCKDPKKGSASEYCFYTSQPEAPSRFRRSSKEFDNHRAGSVPAAYFNSEQKDENLKTPYKFSEKYYLPDASRKSSIEHKTEESCQKVYKDSMVCMVCKNPKSGGKSEQCSHVSDPNDKSYSFTKSHSVGKPKNSKKSSSLRQDKKPAPIHENVESSEPGKVDVSDEKSTQVVKDATRSSECRQVRKDSEICTVCKDPKTGGNSQRCTYNYEPDEKIYKFSRSKSFGYPESARQQSNKDEGDKEVSESDPQEFTSYSDDIIDGEDYSGYDNPEAYSGYENLESPSSDEIEESKESNESKESQNYDYDPDHVEYIRSESEKIIKNAESENCKKVVKDSMTCSICKDPNTGEDSESCSYSYQPDDKKFAYSTSKSFGSPEKSRDGPEEYNEEGSSYGSSENSGEGSYAYASETKPTVSYPTGKLQLTADSNAEEMVFLGKTNQLPDTKVDQELLGTSKNQAKMEQLLKDVQAGNKTRCKKVMKNEMTCYQCVDDTGLRQEECMYIKTPENKSQSFNNSPRESKDLKLDTQPEAAVSVDSLKTKKKKKKIQTKTEETTNLPSEPSALSSERSYRLKRQSRRKKNDNQSYGKDYSIEQNYNSGESYTDNRNQKQDDSPYETDPHNYIADTQYKYDNGLGLKLPLHMFEVSDYEKEFDEIFYENEEN